MAEDAAQGDLGDVSFSVTARLDELDRNIQEAQRRLDRFYEQNEGKAVNIGVSSNGGGGGAGGGIAGVGGRPDNGTLPQMPIANQPGAAFASPGSRMSFDSAKSIFPDVDLSAPQQPPPPAESPPQIRYVQQPYDEEGRGEQDEMGSPRSSGFMGRGFARMATAFYAVNQISHIARSESQYSQDLLLAGADPRRQLDAQFAQRDRLTEGLIGGVVGFMQDPGGTQTAQLRLAQQQIQRADDWDGINKQSSNFFTDNRRMTEIDLAGNTFSKDRLEAQLESDKKDQAARETRDNVTTQAAKDRADQDVATRGKYMMQAVGQTLLSVLGGKPFNSAAMETELAANAAGERTKDAVAEKRFKGELSNDKSVLDRRLSDISFSSDQDVSHIEGYLPIASMKASLGNSRDIQRAELDKKQKEQIAPLVQDLEKMKESDPEYQNQQRRVQAVQKVQEFDRQAQENEFAIQNRLTDFDVKSAQGAIGAIGSSYNERINSSKQQTERIVQEKILRGQDPSQIQAARDIGAADIDFINRQTDINTERQTTAIGYQNVVNRDILDRQPLQAQLDQHRAQADLDRDRARREAPQSPELPGMLEGIDRRQRLQDAISKQDFGDRKEDIDRNLRTALVQVASLRRNDPTFAAAVGTENSAISDATALSRQGLIGEANLRIGLGVSELELQKKNFIEGFKGVQFDPNRTDLGNPRNKIDIAKRLKEINDVEDRLRKMTFRSGQDDNSDPMGVLPHKHAGNPKADPDNGNWGMASRGGGGKKEPIDLTSSTIESIIKGMKTLISGLIVN